MSASAQADPTERVGREVRAFLIAALPEQAHLARELGDDEPLWETFESLVLLDLVEYLENAFDLRVAPIDFVPENFDSVARIARFIARRTRGT